MTAEPGPRPERHRQAGIVTAAHAVVSGSHSGATPAAHAVLPGVLADVPVAVLVIDQHSGAITYANAAAVELAGHVRLPVDVDTWGAKAGLFDNNLDFPAGPMTLNSNTANYTNHDYSP